MKWSKTLDSGPTQRIWMGEGKKGRYFIVVSPGYHPKRAPKMPFGKKPNYLRVQSMGPVEEARIIRNMARSKFSVKLWKQWLEEVDEGLRQG